MAEITAPVEQMSKMLSKAEASIVSTQEKIKGQANEIDQEIDKCYDEQLQKLNEQHKQLKRQLHDAVSLKQKIFDEQLNCIKSAQDELLRLTDADLNTLKKQDIEDRMQKVSKQCETLNAQPVEYDTLEFVRANTLHLFVR